MCLGVSFNDIFFISFTQLSHFFCTFVQRYYFQFFSFIIWKILYFEILGGKNLIYAISDLHLSFSVSKPMDVFGERWSNHHERLRENWNRIVGENDTVVIPGDLSWGMTIEEAKADFAFLDSLPGKKIVGKGNHDYWWQTRKKLDAFLLENKFQSISILYNNAYKVEDKIICGTRGWITENSPDESDEKIVLREAGRLEMSLTCAKDLVENDEEIIVFLHYPPAYRGEVSVPICKQLVREKIKRCYYGHIHSADRRYLISKYGETSLSLIASDFLNFEPLAIE
jgi:predicted phosphohydrolase